MRLTPAEVTAIKAAARQAFGPDAVVRLFGSRADGARNGGDIDLHVEAAQATDPWNATTVFERSLAARIGERKTDVVVRTRGEPARGIDLVAYRDGVVL